MCPNNKSVVYLALSAILSGGAFAQQEVQQEQVVVWGTKVSSDSESLTSDDLSLKQADHMSDLLRDIPGVDVGGTHSVNQRINIRGLGESDLDIRLDGASQHANMFHHIGSLTLNPDILKSADIQVGNNSVVSNGLGGAVYFETKNAKDLLRYDEQFGARIYGGFATNANQQGSVTVYSQLSERVDLMVYGHRISRDNFEDGQGYETLGADGETYNVLSKMGFEPVIGHRFQLSYDVYRDEGDYSPRPDMSGSANEELTNEDLIPTQYNRDTVTASYELDSENHKGKVVLYSSETEIDRDESVITGRWPGNRRSQNIATNRNVGANVKFQFDYGLFGLNNQITYGGDYIDQTSESEYGGYKFMEESTVSKAVFAENNLFLTEDWSVTTGLRYDNYQRKAVTSDQTFDDVTWSLGTQWDVTQDWTLFANARSLFKGPELLETFVRYQDVTFLASDIEAETGLNYQAGMKFDKRINDHFVGLNVTLFKTEIDDYISSEYDQVTGIETMRNTGDMEIEGFEISTSYAYELLSAKLSYSRSDTKDVTNGVPMPNSYGTSADMGDSFAFSVGYQADSIDTRFGWTSIVVLDEDNVMAGAEEKEGYDVHNMHAQWVPHQVPDLVVTFGVDNVFDEIYVSHASRIGTARGILTNDYEPGRNYKLSAAYQF